MDHDQLIDLTRRALKLARDKTTDLAAAAARGRCAGVHLRSSATTATGPW